MKKLYFLIGLAVFGIHNQRAVAQFTYAYPIPNSKYHMPNRIIILRAAEPIDSSSLLTSYFNVTGSESGMHAFSLRLADDKRTINLIPANYFAYAETVTVKVEKGIKTSSGNKLDSFKFSFSIRNAPGQVNGVKKRDPFADADNLYPENAGISTRDGISTREMPNTGSFNILVNTNPDPGNVFFCNGNIDHIHDAQFVDIINNNGDSIFKINYHQYGTDFKLNKNDFLTIFNPDSLEYDIWDSSYHVIQRFKPYDNYTADEHEFMIYPDGHYDMLAKDTLVLNMQVYDSTYMPAAAVVGAIVQKIDSHGNLMTEWRSWDSVAVTESQHIILSSSEVDYVHANSMEEDSDGNVMLSCRHLDQIIKINMETGAMMWRLGGMKNQFIFVNDTAKFSAQHDFRRIANGHYTLFDNGNFHTPAQSFAKEYALDQEHKIATLVWSYAHPYVSGKPVLGLAMGSVQRLPANHTLIDWGLLKGTISPNMTEVDSLGNIVWELKFDDSTNVAYRVHRYAWDPCARPTSYTLTADSVRTTSANLIWTNGTNAEQYTIQVKATSDSNWSNYYVNVPDTVIRLTNLLPEKVYQWRVASICDTLNSSTSVSGYTDPNVFSTIATGVTLIPQPLVVIYPNPASSMLNILLPEKPAHAVHWQLLSPNGAVVMASDFYNSKMSLPLPKLSSGIYLIRLFNADMNLTEKLSIVQ